jgi:hypothetical protein
VLRWVSGTEPRGIRNFPSGHQEHLFGVSGTAETNITLIFIQNPTLLNPLTSLTQVFNLSNSPAVPDNPTNPSKNKDWKFKPIEGFRFPRKKRLFLDHLMKHGGGLAAVY